MAIFPGLDTAGVGKLGAWTGTWQRHDKVEARFGSHRQTHTRLGILARFPANGKPGSKIWDCGKESLRRTASCILKKYAVGLFFFFFFFCGLGGWKRGWRLFSVCQKLSWFFRGKSAV